MHHGGTGGRCLVILIPFFLLSIAAPDALAVDLDRMRESYDTKLRAHQKRITEIEHVLTTNALRPASLANLATPRDHIDAIYALEFTPDGKRIVTGAADRSVKIWDVATQKILTSIAGHSDAIYAVAFSPDGAQVATASYDRLIKLWEVATGTEIRTMRDHIDAIYALEFTPDGKRIVTGSADRSVKVWDVATGTRLYTLSDSTDAVNTVAVSPDGKRWSALLIRNA